MIGAVDGAHRRRAFDARSRRRRRICLLLLLLLISTAVVAVVRICNCGCVDVHFGQTADAFADDGEQARRLDVRRQVLERMLSIGGGGRRRSACHGNLFYWQRLRWLATLGGDDTVAAIVFWRQWWHWRWRWWRWRRRRRRCRQKRTSAFERLVLARFRRADSFEYDPFAAYAADWPALRAAVGRLGGGGADGGGQLIWCVESLSRDRFGVGVVFAVLVMM